MSGERPRPAARRVSARSVRGLPPRTARRRDDEGGGAGTPRWLVPALAVVVGLFVLSFAWRWWGPGREDARVSREARGRTAALAPSHAPAKIRGRLADAPFRIEVLNGSGEPGAAAKLASYLREGGFNVVSVGSADRYDYVRTLVVARTNESRPARAVAGYLGDIRPIVQRARSEADVTVIVGKDRGRTPWGEGRNPPTRG